MFLLTYLALAVGRPATAQYDGALNAGTRVIAERAPIVPAANFSLAQIAGLAKRSGTAWEGAPLGVCTARVTDQLQVSQDHAVSDRCPPRANVEPRGKLARRRIEIDQEVVKRPCLYDVVLKLYRKKTAADDIALAGYIDAATRTTARRDAPEASRLLSQACGRDA